MKSYKDRQIGGINGVVTIRTICKKTGDVIDEFKDNNVVTLNGMEHLWTRAEGDKKTSDYTIQNFVLGSDFGVEEGGDWSIFAPKPAQNNYTNENQFVIYEDSPTNTVFEYPDLNEMQVGTLLDGEAILDEYFPDEVTVRYNSATIRFGDGTVFSYKRFPVRSISRLVDVQILWTFTLVDSALFDCGDIEPPVVEPEPDHSLGISVYAGYWGDNTIHKMDDNAVMLWIYDGHTDWVNDIKVDENYVFSVGRDMDIHIIDNDSSVVYNIIKNAHDDIINRVLIDDTRIVTVSNDQSVKKWNYDDAELLWEFTPPIPRKSRMRWRLSSRSYRTHTSLHIETVECLNCVLMMVRKFVVLSSNMNLSRLKQHSTMTFCCQFSMKRLMDMGTLSSGTALTLRTSNWS